MKRAGLALILCLAAALVLTQPVWPNSADFIITGADQTVNFAMSGAPTFPLSVGPKFNIDTGDNMANIPLAPLSFQIPSIAPKFVIDTADQSSYWGLTPLSFTIPDIAPKYTIDTADNMAWIKLEFPDFIPDSKPPVITVPPSGAAGNGTVTITFTTDEYSTVKILYGFSSGSYPYFVVDIIFAYKHQVTITLPAESKNLSAQTLYYQLQFTDRSGNSATTGEYQYIPAPPRQNFYLPFVKR